MSTVFLCHATKDKPFIRRLARTLEKNGLKVWLDEKELHVGDSLVSAIEEAIERSDYVVVALSRVALKRKWVLRELHAAYAIEDMRGKKVILPVLIEKAELPLFLRDKKYADFSNGFRSGITELLKAFGGPKPDISLETRSCTVLLDILRVDGSLVRYRKVQVVRALASEVPTYTEAFSTEGTISDFRCIPGSIDSVWKEGGTVHVRTLFPSPLRKGQVRKRVFLSTWHSSFTSVTEYWEERQHHPSKDVQVLVRFPKSRPPKAWETSEKEGSTSRPSPWKATLVTRQGKPTLRLFIPTPRALHSYWLRWKW